MAKAQQDIILRLQTEGLQNLEELKAKIKEVKQEFQNAKVGSDEFYKSANKLRELNSAYKELQSVSKNTTSGLHSLYFTLGTIQRAALLSIGTIYSLAQGISFLANAAKEGARIELLRATLDQLAKKEGVDFAEMMQRIDTVTGGTISTVEKLNAIMKLHQLGIGWEQMVEIFAIADDKAKIFGESIDSIIDKMAKAATGSQEVMKGLLIPVDVEAAQRRFAQQLGVTVDQLSEAGKKQAVFNEMLRVAGEQVRELQPTQKENVERIERLNAAWENLLSTLKELATELTPLFTFLVDVVNAVSKGVTAIARLIMPKKTEAKGEEVERARGILQKSAQEFLAHVPEEYKTSTVTTPKTTTITQKPVDRSKYIDEEKAQKDRITKIKEQISIRLQETELQYKLTKNVDIYVQQLREIQQLALTRVESLEIEYKIQQALLERKEEQQHHEIRLAELRYEITGNAEEYLTVLQHVIDTTDDEVKKLELQKRYIEIINDEIEKRERKEKEIVETLRKQYDNLEVSSKTLISGIGRGFSQLANEIYYIWENKILSQMIGNTRTAFAILANAIVDEFIQLGARLASMQIISWLFPSLGGFDSVLKIFGFQHGGVIDEPIIGKGLQTGAYYAFGERAPMVPELIRPINQSMQYNAVQTVKPMIEVVPIVGPDKLSVMVKYGDQRRSRRYM